MRHELDAVLQGMNLVLGEVEHACALVVVELALNAANSVGKVLNCRAR